MWGTNNGKDSYQREGGKDETADSDTKKTLILSQLRRRREG